MDSAIALLLIGDYSEKGGELYSNPSLTYSEGVAEGNKVKLIKKKIQFHFCYATL